MKWYEYGQEDEFFDQLIEAGGVYEIFDGGMIKVITTPKGIRQDMSARAMVTS